MGQPPVNASVLLRMTVTVSSVKIIVLVSVLIAFFQGSHGICSPLYGAEPCLFVPAPPGKTPSCARPGLTYCEHSPHYPKELIKHLISLWRYDKRTLFLDETQEDFNSYIQSYPEDQYNINSLPINGPTNFLSPENQLPEPIYIPKPPFSSSSYNPISNRYIPPPLERVKNFSHFNGYPDRRPYSQQIGLPSNQFYNYKQINKPQSEYGEPGFYNNNYNQQRGFVPSHNNYNYNNANDYWQRPIRDVKDQLKKRNKRSMKTRRHIRSIGSLSSPSNVTVSFLHHRKKRQSNPTGQTLCQARTQFVMPEAAMNSQGNWMYVVNVQEGNNRYTQLVRSETCATQQCSGLCGLPSGYSSRCEQKYIQKRLVALEGTGNNLYTDLFWIPSCCVCTITQG